jgi:hypothetical protein
MYTRPLTPALPPPPHTHTGSTHGRVVETVYTVTGATAKPLLPKGSLRVTDASGRLVCDLGAEANGSSSAAAAQAAESAAVPHRRGPPERPEARAYWGRVVMHQVRGDVFWGDCVCIY